LSHHGHEAGEYGPALAVSLTGPASLLPEKPPDATYHSQCRFACGRLVAPWPS
jgi:hypothetical protein